LPVTKDEPSLAIVLGHEIAHAVARHSAEQYSTQYRQQYGMQIGSAVASAVGVGSNTIALGQAMASKGMGLANLKYSRNHESEADHLGLIFAAMAGYDPQVAVGFWQRMAAQSSNTTAEFLSSHPSDATRIRQIQGWMPEALKYYKAATGTSGKTSFTVPGTSSKTSKSGVPQTTKTIHISSKKK
jgi:predicted Zn-dependent protease